MPELIDADPSNRPRRSEHPRPATAWGGRPPAAPPQGPLGLGATTRALHTSLQMPSGLPLATWLRVGRQLCSLASSSAWWAGDWLIYGASTYPDRYRLAVEKTSLDYQTLRNYAWVARKFEVSRRRENLSFQHHQEVAALTVEEQERWLDRAAECGWSKAELRRQLRRGPAEAAADTFRTRLQFELAEDQWARWQRAADGDVIGWLTKVADLAAVGRP